MTPITDPQLSPPAPTVWPSVGFTDVDVDVGVRFLTEGLGFVVTALPAVTTEPSSTPRPAGRTAAG